MKRPSILHIGKFYPPHPGGMEAHVRDLTRYQSREADVTVFVSSDQRKTVTERLDNAEVTRLATFGSVASMPITPALLPRLIGRRDDVVHLHLPNPAAAAAFLLSGHTGRLVIGHHGDTLNREWLRKLADPFTRRAMEHADAISVSSQRYVDSSDELLPFRDKCHIIHAGVDIAEVTPETLAEAQRIRTSYRGPLIVTAGRQVPYKGFEYLLRAMRDVNATLLLIGRGPLHEELQRLAVECGIADRVHFLGFVPAVEPYLHAADLFVMPSITRAESFGLVQLEAMAAGVTVINTDIASAVPEVSVHGLTGLTVPPADADALAKAMNTLLQDDEMRRRFGQEGIRRAPEFASIKMADRHMALYLDVMKRPRRK